MEPRKLRELLAANVRRLAQRRGLSPNALADLVGLSRGTVHYLVTGQTAATIDTIARVAGGLDVHPARLLAPARPRARDAKE